MGTRGELKGKIVMLHKLKPTADAVPSPPTLARHGRHVGGVQLDYASPLLHHCPDMQQPP